MKYLVFASAMAAASLLTAAIAADIVVSVTIGQPEFYGQLDLDNVERPQTIYARPIIINHPPPGIALEPLYLHVPPDHVKNWEKYCSRYDACGRQVYFVRDDWYNKVYVPRRHEVHSDQREDHRAERSERNDHESHRDNGPHDNH